MGEYLVAKVFEALIEISIEKVLDSLKSNFLFNKLLKEVGFHTLIEDSYASNYIRTLLIINDNPDYRNFILLFKEEIVYESFILSDKKNDREIFNRELDNQLHTNSKFRNLKYFNTVPAFLVAEFNDTFNRCREDTWTPNDVYLNKRFNELDEHFTDGFKEIKSLLYNSPKILITERDENIDNYKKISKLTKNRIDSIFEDIKKGKVDTGLKNLFELKSDLWTDIDYELRNSLLKKIAYCYLEKKDLIHSIRFYEEALAVKKDAGTYSILAILYHRDGQQLKLVNCLNEFDEVFPEKSELTRLRFGTSSKTPKEYYRLIVNKQITEEETIISLCQYFSEIKDYYRAFEVGCLLIEIYDKVEYKEYVSEIGVLYLQARGIHMGINYLNSQDRKFYEKGLEYVTSCSDYYINAEAILYKSSILQYRSIYEMWSGNFDLALHFINKALTIDTDNFQFKKTLGSIYSKQKEFIKVIELFDGIPEEPGTEDIPLMKSICHFVLGNIQDSINTLKSALIWIKDISIKERTLVQLINYYFISDEIANAEETFITYNNSFNQNSNKLINAKLLKYHGYDKEAKTIFIELKNDLIALHEFSPILLDLGIELEEINEVDSAIELFEYYSNYNEDTVFLRKLFDFYLKTGRLNKAVEICEAQRENVIHEFFAYYEIKIFFTYKDYNRVFELGKRYIENYPNNIDIRLLIIYSLLKKDKKELAKEYLKFSVDITKLDELNAQNLIDLYLKLNQIEEAFEIAYKLLAYNNKDVLFNDLYIRVCINNDRFMMRIDMHQILPDTTVVFCENDENKVLTFNNNESHDYQQRFYNEIRIDDPKYHHLYGKKIGEIVTINYQNQEFKFEIKEVKHRFIYAFHKAIQNCGTNFKEASAIKMLDASSLSKGVLPDFIKDILQKSEKSEKEFENLLKQYEIGRIPLVSFANISNLQIYDLWQACTTLPNHFIRASSGNLNEFERIFPYLESNEKKELLFDITSLLLINKVGVIDYIKKYFSVYIIQDVLDYFEEYVAINSIGIDNKSATISRVNGKNYFFTFSKDEKRERIIQIQSIINWIKANFEIRSPDILFKINNQQVDEYVKLFDPITAKSCLISGNSDIIFICDDLAMINVFISEFNKPAVWTQSLFSFLNHLGNINIQEYNDVCRKLVESNVHYTHINSFILFDAFNAEDFLINKTTLKFTDILRGNNSDNSAFFISFDFLKKIWTNADIEINKKRRITKEVLLSLFISRCNYDVYRYIRFLNNVTFDDFDIRREIINQIFGLERILKIHI